MKTNGFIWLIWSLALLSASAQATLSLTLEGKVEVIQGNTIILKNGATYIQVAKRTIQSENIRPGDDVIAVVDSADKVKTWAVEKSVIARPKAEAISPGKDEHSSSKGLHRASPSQ